MHINKQKLTTDAYSKEGPSSNNGLFKIFSFVTPSPAPTSLSSPEYKYK